MQYQVNLPDVLPQYPDMDIGIFEGIEHDYALGIETLGSFETIEAGCVSSAVYRALIPRLPDRQIRWSIYQHLKKWKPDAFQEMCSQFEFMQATV